MKYEAIDLNITPLTAALFHPVASLILLQLSKEISTEVFKNVILMVNSYYLQGGPKSKPLLIYQ